MEPLSRANESNKKHPCHRKRLFALASFPGPQPPPPSRPCSGVAAVSLVAMSMPDVDRIRAELEAEAIAYAAALDELKRRTALHQERVAVRL